MVDKISHSKGITKRNHARRSPFVLHFVSCPTARFKGTSLTLDEPTILSQERGQALCETSCRRAPSGLASRRLYSSGGMSGKGGTRWSASFFLSTLGQDSWQSQRTTHDTGAMLSDPTGSQALHTVNPIRRTKKVEKELMSQPGLHSRRAVLDDDVHAILYEKAGK